MRDPGRAVAAAALLLFASAPASESVGAPASFHARVQSKSPLLWYRLGETSGNAINSGTLGASHDATFNGTIGRGVSTFVGDGGSRFDSSDDFLESLSASTVTGNPSFSCEAIVRLDSPGNAANWGPFLHWGQGTNAREVYFSVSNALNDRLYAGFYNGGLRTASVVPTNQWIHVVWTRIGGSASNTGSKLFINGRAVAMEIDPALSPGVFTSAQINVVATTFRVNRATDFIGSRFFTGSLDEVALYGRRLTATEVRNNAMESGLPGAAMCDGDADGDHAVNFTDLNIVLSEFGQNGVGLDGDLNDDGTVNFTDLNIVLSSFGVVCP